jgi:prepilin-type N-terminal cleavage/methylation domain-containing protein
MRIAALINRRQQGITLIELLVGMAIAAVLSLAASMLFYQLMVVNASSSNHILAVRQVQNAGYWISRDATGAQSIIGDADPETSSFLTLRWSDWEGVDYEAFYYFDGDTLRRSFTVGEAAPIDVTVAEHLDTAATTIEKSGSVWVLTVKATVGGFPWPSSETRTYEIMPRPPSI